MKYFGVSGVEEGQRYIEKTVSKHSEMVESIRELSDGLIELEAKLKVNKLFLKAEIQIHAQETWQCGRQLIEFHFASSLMMD